jgi:hypothetical protein
VAVGIRHIQRPAGTQLDQAAIVGTLLETQQATTNGVWQSIQGFHPVTVTVEGTFSGTIKVLVSNAEAKPDDSDNAKPQIGSDITAPGRVSIDQPHRWIKAIVSTYVSGAINSYVWSG